MKHKSNLNFHVINILTIFIKLITFNKTVHIIVQCFLANPVLANPAGFSLEIDLFTLAFNIILLQKSIQFRLYKQASNIL